MAKHREDVLHIVGQKKLRQEVLIELILEGRFNFWFTVAYFGFEGFLIIHRLLQLGETLEIMWSSSIFIRKLLKLKESK